MADAAAYIKNLQTLDWVRDKSQGLAGLNQKARTMPHLYVIVKWRPPICPRGFEIRERLVERCERFFLFCNHGRSLRS
jgi:hypothetical protein